MISFCSQLKKDYDRFSFHGFHASVTKLPNILANKDNAKSEDLVKYDFSDPNDVEKMMRRARDRLKTMYANTPQIKIMIGGNFLEMVDRGLFKLQ